MKKFVSKAVAFIFVATVLVVSAASQAPNSAGRWVTAWSTAVHTPLSFPGMPPAAGFDNQTVRMVIRPTIGGNRIRIRFSNELSNKPLTIGSAHVALVKESGAIVPESDRPLKFGGAASVTISAGSPFLSDPVELSFPAFTELAVSIFLPDETAPLTFHLLGQHDTYISGPGDLTGAKEIENPKITQSWYFLSALEVTAPPRTASIVALGDSITDGFGAKAKYGDWPNQLARRFAESKGATELAVNNEGIGGNRILYYGAGVDALARFDRDVVSQSGVTELIVLEGINDIGWPHMKPPPMAAGSPRENPFANQMVTADDLIRGLKQIIERAHEHGIRVFGATMTPYEGADYYTEDGEVVRKAVNEWIRTGGSFDGVFDFDAAVRDPEHPSKFREDLHTGDHLHPNASGYMAMAAAINLSALRPK